MYPYIFVFGRAIGTYGLCMAVAVLLVGVLSAVQMRKRGQSVDDLLIVGGFGLGLGLVCGRVLYLLVTYSFAELMEIVRQRKWQYLQGGIVFYGALLGGLLGGVLGCRVAGCSVSRLEDSVVPYLPLGHAVGRIGCMMAGCCHGLPYDGFLAIYYPHSVSGLSPTQGYFPLQAVEALLNIAICGVLLRCRRREYKRGDLIMTYLAGYGAVRFCLEFARGDSIRGFAWVLSTSQWISLLCLAACGGYFLLRKK